MSIVDSLNPFAKADSPHTNYHFRVDFGIPGFFVKDVGFKNIDSFGVKLNPLKPPTLPGVKVSETDLAMQKVNPTLVPEYSDLTMHRGMISGSMLINWLEMQIISRKKIPIPIIVTMLDSEHLPIYSWFFFNAYPISWETGPFNAMASGENAILVEKITFKYMFYKQVNMSYLSASFSAVKSLF